VEKGCRQLRVELRRRQEKRAAGLGGTIFGFAFVRTSVILGATSLSKSVLGVVRISFQ
jgi:hypothetical protein